MPTSTSGPRMMDPEGPPAGAASRAPLDPEPPRRSAGFRRLLEGTRIVPWEADARTWAFTFVGPQAVRLLGYPVARWYAPDFWATHVHPDDRERVLQVCEQAAQEREAYELEYRMIAASGPSVWVHDIVAVERVDGAPAVIRGFLIDVTERKRAEATARASEARLRQLIEQAPDPIIAVRADGQVDLCQLVREVREISRSGRRSVRCGFRRVFGLVAACGCHGRPVGRFKPADPVIRVSGSRHHAASSFVALGYTRPS